MKRTAAVFMAILLLIAAVLPAGAAEPAFTPEETEALYQKFCANYGYTPHEIVPDSPEFGEVDIFEVRGVSNGFAMCMAMHYYFIASPAEYHARLNGYAVYAGNWYRPDKAGISIISIDDDTVYTLEEAAEANAVDMKEVAQAFPDNVRKIGDLDRDEKLSIIDVICLQNHLARNAYVSGLEWHAADFNGDNTLNLTDVIQMQKAIAKAI